MKKQKRQKILFGKRFIYVLLLMFFGFIFVSSSLVYSQTEPPVPDDVSDALNNFEAGPDLLPEGAFPAGQDPFLGDDSNPKFDIEQYGDAVADYLDEMDDPAEEPVANFAPVQVGDEQMIDVLQLKDMDIMDVFKLISEKTGVNIVATQAVKGKVTIYLKNVKLENALRIILVANNLAYSLEDDIITIMPAKEFEDRFGYVFGGKIQTKIIHLRYADGKDVFALLDQIKSSSGKIIFDAKSNTLVLMDTPKKIEEMANLIQEVDTEVETKVFHLNYALVNDVSEKISNALTPGLGKIEFDERSNKMVITDTDRKMTEIENVIQAFDVKERQVLIKAKIIQIILTDRERLGIDWETIVSGWHDLTFKSNFDVLGETDKMGKISIGTLDNDNYVAFLEALKTYGNSNILSDPSIISLNNQEAKILIGSTEPYVTTTTTTPSSGPTTTAESVNFIEVGVKLFVTPTIHPDDFITMKIKPEVSSVTQTITTSNNNTIPVVDTSEAETTVRVKDGVTIFIGGLIKDEKINSYNKVPLLGDIPYFGQIFRNSDERIQKTETIILLTPTIITGDIPVEAPTSL